MARDYSIKNRETDPNKFVYRQERDLTKTTVDWGTVTKNLTKTITDIRDDRETRKQEIQDATTTAMNDLAKMDQYASESLNVKVLEGSQWGSEFLASQNYLMQNGYLKPSDYLQSKQKVSDSFTQLKTALGTFDEAYVKAQERQNSEDWKNGNQSNSFEQGLMLQMSGLSGLSQWEFAGNPATGDMGFIKDGADPSNPSNIMGLNSINQRLTQRSNYVPSVETAADIVLNLGAEIEASFIAEGGTGSVESVEDWLEKEDSEDMLKSLVNVATSTDARVLSILQEAGVTAQMYTMDPAVAAANPGDGTINNPGYVLMVPTEDGQGTMDFELSPEQKKLVDQEAEKSIKGQLDKKITLTKGHQKVFPPASAIKEDDKNTTSVGYMRDIIDLTEADSTKATSAANALASRINKHLPDGAPQITSIERIVNSQGGTVGFEINRDNKEPYIVDVNGMSNQDAQRALYINVTPNNVLEYYDALDVWGGRVGDEFGQGGATGRGQIDKMATLDFERPVALGGVDQTFRAYIDDELGDNLQSSADSVEEVVDLYQEIFNAMLPSDMFDAVNGEVNVRYSAPGDQLIWTIGERGDPYYVEKFLPDSFGDNDSTLNHYEYMKKLVRDSREKLVRNRRGSSGAGQVKWNQWKQNNPNGTFAEWMATQ